jgi:thioredoxin-like negative regulator of GroEL
MEAFPEVADDDQGPIGSPVSDIVIVDQHMKTRSGRRAMNPVIVITGSGRGSADPKRSNQTPECTILAIPLRPVHGREYQLLTEAHRARNKGNDRAAIRLYRRILVENPRNLEVALRVAPMLAWAGEAFEAWQLYRRVALEYVRKKKYTECLAVYREACRFVPFEFEAWRLCAELQLKMKRADGAFETLVDGRMNFGGPQTRAQAIALLSRAREIEPWDDHLLLDLATLYTANDQADLALELLSTLSCRVRGVMLRRVRLLQLRLTLSLRYVYLWIRAFGETEFEPSIPQRDPVPVETRESPRLRRVESRTA